MGESAPRTSLRSFKDGKDHARRILREIGAGHTQTVQNNASQIPKGVFDYFFRLQGDIEKEGAMDYHNYATRMWKQLSGNEGASTDEAFSIFERSLITGLHSIDMNELVYPHVVDRMPQLIQQYGDIVGTVALWSTGDVTATGYQPGKIERSGIISNFFGELKKQLPKNSRSTFVKEKTAYLVDDNKFDRLAEFVGEKLEQNPDNVVKLVIIEDSVGNFDKAKKILAEKFGEGKVEVVPIWFTGSREGITAQKTVDQLKDDPESEEYQKAKDALEKKKLDLNAVDTFDELLDATRFKDIFNGAHVMVDFDGVVADNLRMRDQQASVTNHALQLGIMKRYNLTELGAQSLINARLVNVKS